MKILTRGATRLIVLALGLGLLPSAWADFTKTNPVTGETETYTWKFVGTDTWNGSQYWEDSTGANPADGGVPAKKIETVVEYKEKALMKSMETNGMTMEEKRKILQIPQIFFSIFLDEFTFLLVFYLYKENFLG